MAMDSLSINTRNGNHMQNFPSPRKREITYGYIDLERQDDVIIHGTPLTTTDKVLAATGALTGVTIPLLTFMKKQKVKNPFKLKYKVGEMLTMAAGGNLGGILLSSIGEPDIDKKKKWKEGAFQMMLTSLPILFVDGGVKLCEKVKNKKINNNFVKVLVSAAGVALGSNLAVELSNKLRRGKDAKKPARELKPIDMIANIDDIVAIMVLAKIPFASKIKIERALPLIYSFCGYRSGTADRKPVKNANQASHSKVS